MNTIFLKPKLIPEFKLAQVLPILPVDFSDRRGVAAAPIGTRIAPSVALRLEALAARPGTMTVRPNLNEQEMRLVA